MEGMSLSLSSCFLCGAVCETLMALPWFSSFKLKFSFEVNVRVAMYWFQKGFQSLFLKKLTAWKWEGCRYILCGVLT